MKLLIESICEIDITKLLFFINIKSSFFLSKLISRSSTTNLGVGNRLTGQYYHSDDQIELNTYYTMVISFKLLNTEVIEGVENSGDRDAGTIKFEVEEKWTDLLQLVLIIIVLRL